MIVYFNFFFKFLNLNDIEYKLNMVFVTRFEHVMLTDFLKILLYTKLLFLGCTAFIIYRRTVLNV